MITPCFKQTTNIEIVTTIRELAVTERKVTLELLHHLSEMEKRRCYAEIGFPSTFEFLTKELGYSESATWRRISAARLLNAVPETAEKVKSGEVNLTNLAHAQSVISTAEKMSGLKMNAELKAEVVRQVEGVSSREADRNLKEMFPEVSLKQEIVRAVNEDHVRAHVTFTRAQLEKLERLREVFSHQKAGASLADIIEAAADELLSRKDPLKRNVKPRVVRPKVSKDMTGKAIPTELTASETPNAQCATGAGVKNTEPLAPSIRNLVFRRDNGKCQHVNHTTGEICGSGRFLEVDHIVPRALGGSNNPDNLRILCRTHNIYAARQIFGADVMDRYRKELHLMSQNRD